jgi:hypothetical protein
MPKTGIVEDREYDTLMFEYFSKSVPFSFTDPEPGQGVDLVIAVNDEYFPNGGDSPVVYGAEGESTTWQFQFIGLGNHLFLYCNLTNDLTHDSKEFYINVCPFQILHEPKLKANISRLRSIVGSSPDNSLNVHLVGEKYLDFMLRFDSVNMDVRKELEPRYVRNFSTGKVNCYPLPLIYDLIQISPNSIYNSISGHCPNCQKYANTNANANV